MSGAVQVLGVGMTPFGRFTELSVKDLTRQAVSAALADAGAGLGDVEMAFFSNVRQGQMEGQNSIRGQCALRAMGVEGIPIVNVENACASSSTAVMQAAAQIRAGAADLVLVAAAEKMVFPDRRKEMFAAFMGGTDVALVEETHARLAGLGREVVPEGLPEPVERSFFMDLYAALARRHMARYGTTVRQIAATAAKNHDHSAANPLAQYRVPMSVEAVLADLPIVWPLTRAMCAPISDGGAAVLVGSARAAARLGARRAIRLRGMALTSGTNRDPEDDDRQTGRLAAAAAYAAAGIGPDEVDLAEVHDATAFGEILQVENLGLVARGEGGPAAERGETRLGGRVPVNTSGGLVSKGHPIAATGLGMLHELVTQLRGEAGARQVAGARVAAMENGGGFLGVEEAATVVAVLSRD